MQHARSLEDRIEDLRHQLSMAHSDHGGSAHEFRRLKRELDRLRGKG